jgi:hypothetical protein
MFDCFLFNLIYYKTICFVMSRVFFYLSTLVNLNLLFLLVLSLCFLIFLEIFLVFFQ